MTDNPRLQQLLDELLDSQSTPEDVCRSDPELLPEVRAYLREVRRVRSQLDTLFPALPGADGGAPPPPPEETALPQIPLYEVQRVLGRGGAGVVYEARHLRLNRSVALKMLLAGPYARPDERERFLREAEAVAGLRHPNVVQLYEVGEVDGRPYFTMELVEGGSLAQQIQGVPQPVRKAAALVATLADAVHVAHQSGVMHRDLKPANILLTADGTPKVTDFGLARRLQGGGALTLSGVPMGTPSYMAPEQAQGKRDAAGPATDVYALGAILYELLTGRPPFRAATGAETVQQVISQEPAPPSRLNDKVPRDLETICLKCLHKEPGRRYASAAALADDLRRFGAGRPIQARPLGRGERLWRWGRRNPTAAALLVTALALVGLASGGGVWLARQRAERQAEVARLDGDLRNEIRTAVAQAASLRNGFHFREARELLEQARQRLVPAGPDDLSRQVEQAQAYLKLAERLDSARLETASLAGGRDGLEAVEPLYKSAFAEAGLGGEGDDVKSVSARVRDSALSTELIAALDDWASITADRARREWLLAVASEADQNAARNRLRQPELWQDGVRLTQLAQESLGAEVSPQLAVALDRAAQQSGGDALALLTAVQARYPQDFWINFGLGARFVAARRLDEALSYDRAALAVRPDVSVAQSNLGGVLYTMGRMEEAIGHFSEAVRLDPNSATAHINLGVALHREGRLDEAVDHFQQALRLDPKFAVTQAGLNGAIADATRTVLRAAAGHDPQKGHLKESQRPRARLQVLSWLRRYLEVAIKLQDSGERPGWSPASWQTDPDLASVRDPAELAKLPVAEREQWQLLWADVAAHVAADPLGQGRAHAARREWANGADGYARALKQGPTDDGHFWYEYAALLLLSGDRPGYAKACAHLVEQSGKDKGPRSYHVARACTLAPDAVADMSLPGRLAGKELQGSREFWSLTEQGALAYRAGRFQEAVPLFEQSLRANPKPGASVLNWLWLALAHQRLGKAEEARRWLGKAQAWLDQYGDGMPASAEVEVGLHLHNWLEAHVLRREAETLIPAR
jgi:tetratricopeptide (TPR) repeat protein/predicted Ser/Thr protein kinase